MPPQRASGPPQGQKAQGLDLAILKLAMTETTIFSDLLPNGSLLVGHNPVLGG